MSHIEIKQLNFLRSLLSINWRSALLVRDAEREKRSEAGGPPVETIEQEASICSLSLCLGRRAIA